MSEPYKADVIAAERLLKAAVRRAVEMIREQAPRVLFIPPSTGPLTFSTGSILAFPEPEQPDPVVTMLAEAGRSAELLLDGGA